MLKYGGLGQIGILGLILGLAAGSAGAENPAPSGPLDVDGAVRIALAQNYAYRQAQAGEDVAAGSRRNALAGLLPGVGGSWSYNRSKSTSTLQDIPLETRLSDVPPTVVQAGDLDLDSDRRSSGFGFSASENLSLTQWFSYRSSNAEVTAAQYGTKAFAQQLAFDVRRQFYLMLRAQDLLHVQSEDLRLAVDEERRINSMFELGSVARVDVLKARVRVSDAEVALIQQENAVEIEMARLTTLLGLPPDTRLQLSGDLEYEPMVLDSVAAAAGAATRPSLLRSQEIVRSASHAHKAAATSWVPTLFADFNWSQSTGTSIADNPTEQVVPGFPAAGDTTSFLRAFSTDSDTKGDGWSLRVGASINLDIFLNTGSTKRAAAIKNQAEYDLEGQELEALRELEEAILNYRASLRAIDAADRGVESADEDLRLSQERYQQGLGTVLELLEAQVNLTRARNTLVNALTGLKISEAAMDKAQGAPLPEPVAD